MSEECIQIHQDWTVLSFAHARAHRHTCVLSLFFFFICTEKRRKNPTGTHLHLTFKTYTIFIYQSVTLKTFFTFPVRYLVPSFLTRAVLCAGKEAWKRRPFLLSSQICSNYRITSICGSLAAFSLPPPSLFSTLLPVSPLLLLLFYLHSPLFLYLTLLYFYFFCLWLTLVHSEHFYLQALHLKLSSR